MCGELIILTLYACHVKAKPSFTDPFPTAFNPCIVRWHDRILMSFRIRHPETKATDQIGMVWLDEQLDPIEAPQILNGPRRDYSNQPWPQDPRLITLEDRLYMVYSDMVDLSEGPRRRMFMTEIVYDGHQFHTGPTECFLKFHGQESQYQQKNWVPFHYDGQLLLAYSIIPHRILIPLSKGKCRDIGTTNDFHSWDWGEVRGGTSALKVGDEYLAFFHSLKGMATVQSGGKTISHYFMAAYTFEGEAPFRITRVSPQPLMAHTFYDGPAYQTWKPLRVVFPCGYIFDDRYIWISYGKQDHELWIAKIDRAKLLNSLIPITHD